jgi:hypothetical protein
VSTPQGPELHRDLSGQKESVLLLTYLKALLQRNSVLKEDNDLEMKEDPDLPEDIVRKKQPELVLKEDIVLEMKKDPNLPKGTVAKEQPELFLRKTMSLRGRS